MYIIKSVAMANFLILNGFVLKSIDRDRNNRDRLIFLFEDSDKLRLTMKEYVKQ